MDRMPAENALVRYTLVTAQLPLLPPPRPPGTNGTRETVRQPIIRSTHFCVPELIMKTYDILLSAVATILVVAGAASCRADASDGTGAQSLELNKSITRRVYEEGLNQGRFEVPYSADFVGRGGRATFTHADGMAEAKGWRAAFPDLKITVDKQVAERDLVAVRWTARGTNTGTGNGIAATGRAVQVTGTTLFRLADGHIAEEWTCADSLGLMRQLGMLATPAAAPATGGSSAGTP